MSWKLAPVGQSAPPPYIPTLPDPKSAYIQRKSAKDKIVETPVSMFNKKVLNTDLLSSRLGKYERETPHPRP